MSGLGRRGALVFAAALPAAVLWACKSRVVRPAWPDVTFQHKTPIRLDVARVEVINAAPATEDGAQVQDMHARLPLSPTRTVERWASERLDPVGDRRLARVTITEDRFVEVPLDTKSGIEGLFTVDQSERYEASLAMRIDILEDPGLAGFAAARATASRTVPEDASLYEREQALYDMTAQMIRALDERLEQEMRANLPSLVL